MTRTLENIEKNIEYVRGLEKFGVFVLGLNEIYSFFETNKAFDKVRTAISRYLGELSNVREELEEEIKQTERREK
jgi:hypothetical protein